MTQATTIKARLAAELGTSHGSGPSIATPPPEVLAELDGFDGLPDTKVQRIRAVAVAALDGLLNPDTLRGTANDEALDSLQTIEGIGPFSAGLILVRGAGEPDVFPQHEKRLHKIMRDRYDSADASTAELAEIASSWKPFRSWISFQFRSLA